MESLNKTIIIAGNLLALAVSECILYFVVVENSELYISIPVGIGMIGLVIVVCISIANIDYSEFHNTFAVFDYRTLVRMIVKSWDGFSFLIGAAMTFGIYGIILMIFPLIMTLIGFAISIAVYIVYCAAVMAIYIAVMWMAKTDEAGRYIRDTRRCVCPDCGAIFDRPIYYCSCGQRYPTADGLELRPSIHGLRYTHCAGCDTKLPVTDRRKDRRLLNAECPECRGAILTKEAHPYVITLAGPSRSGKTSLAFSAMEAMERSGRASYPYGNAYSRSTPGRYSPPYVICADVSRRTERYLAMFDINGSYFSSSENDMGQQPQYGLEDAIFLTVDPTAPDAAAEAEMAVNEFWQKYHAISQTSLTSTVSVPVHLVVTRGDRIGKQADVRGYLESAGFGRLTSLLGSSFSDVSYHICDARDAKDVAAVFFDAFTKLDADVANIFHKAK